MRDFDLRALQLVELQMLKDFHVFCEENDIVYFLCSGTALGAARHQGFIPWDDDIDVCMDVRNYRKFLKIAPDKLPNRYFCQNYRTDRKVGIMWSRVRINGTTSMERNMTNYDIHYGVCMDIFVKAGVRRTKIGKRIQAKASTIWSVFLEKYFSEAAGYDLSPNLKRLYRLVPEWFRILACRFLERIVLADTHKCKTCYNIWHRDPSSEKVPHLPSEFFRTERRVKLPFEDDEFYTLEQYDKYLEMTYGDWKTIPKREEQVTHGDIIVDLENDYSKYFTGKKDV